MTAEVDPSGPLASFELRPESPADSSFLFALYCDVRSEELAQTGWPPEQVEAFLRSQFELQTRAYRATFPAAEFNLIMCGGQPAGRIYVARLADEIRLVDLALVAEFRNRGVGTALLRGLVASADQAGVPVRFHVERSNRARHLYERFGFQIVSENGPYFLLERQRGGGGPS